MNRLFVESFSCLKIFQYLYVFTAEDIITEPTFMSQVLALLARARFTLSYALDGESASNWGKQHCLSATTAVESGLGGAQTTSRWFLVPILWKPASKDVLQV